MVNSSSADTAAAAATCSHHGADRRFVPRPPTSVPPASIRNVNSRVSSSTMTKIRASTSHAIHRYCVRSGNIGAPSSLIPNLSVGGAIRTG